MIVLIHKGYLLPNCVDKLFVELALHYLELNIRQHHSINSQH